MEKFKTYWSSREPREQRLLAAGLILVAVALLYFAWIPFANERARLQRRLPLLEQDVKRMQGMVARWQTLGGGAAAQQDWRTVAQSSLNMHGIASQQARLVSSTPEVQQWQFDKVEFNRFLDWLTALYNNNGVRVRSIAVEPQGSGVVSVKLELTHV